MQERVADLAAKASVVLQRRGSSCRLTLFNEGSVTRPTAITANF